MDTSRARRIQRDTATQVRLSDDLPPVRTVAGVDVGFENADTARAAIVVLDYRTLEPLDYALARLPVAFPYVPGLLSFRECPVILRALEQLRVGPDVLLCDGHGIAHPRRLGIAAHLGVLTGLPTVGVAKSASPAATARCRRGAANGHRCWTAPATPWVPSCAPVSAPGR